MKWKLAAVALSLAALLGISGCVSTELAFHDFEQETISVDARMTSHAEVDADYDIVIDPERPILSVLSVGTTIAQAEQVRQAEEKLYRAMRQTDIRVIVEHELSEFAEESLGAKVVANRRGADLELQVDIVSYGIDADRFDSAVEFQMTAFATLWDTHDGDRIWRTWTDVSEPISLGAFGLPDVAGNVLTAMALADLTEEEIANGLTHLAREAAWDIGAELQRDIYRARRYNG